MSPNETTPSSAPKSWPKRLVVISMLYGAWLLWLAYVAWINIRAGNQ